MINSYLRTFKFEIDGSKYTESHIILECEKLANLNQFILAQGNTFDELWDFMKSKKELAFFGYCHEPWFLSRKRNIEFNFFSDIPTWYDNGTKKEWTVSVKDKLYKVSMKELMNQDADDVIEYLKERGISSININ